MLNAGPFIILIIALVAFLWSIDIHQAAWILGLKGAFVTYLCWCCFKEVMICLGKCKRKPAKMITF